MKISVNNIIISIDKNQDIELKKELLKRGIPENIIEKIEYSKRSIDSRKKSDIKFVYNIDVSLSKDIDISGLDVKSHKEKEKISRERKKEIKEVVIVGAGPAGLFSALRLCQYGIKPIIFERGEKIENRDITVDKFIKSGVLNSNSNIQFGEGGAGTYSDGKLNTRVKSGYINEIFLELVKNGAQEKILWDYKPHIGTDILKKVVKSIREKIISLGGEFKFNSLMEEIILKDNKIVGLKIKELDKKLNSSQYFQCENVILAIGHSSRDTYRMLSRVGVFLENKPFAIGARIEHFSEDINKMQYGKNYKHPKLEPATYNLTYNNRDEGRGIFSFCMCPGGVIVNAASEEGGSLVNGMSYSTRDGKFSNSALVVGIKENEFGNHLFSGMEYQEKLERKTYEIIKEYGAIYQNTLDFLNDKKTQKKIESSYEMKLESYNLNNFFPEVITKNMKMAMKYWEKTQNGFISKNANLIAPETRTSAPIRITRNEFGESLNIKGLYPIGEGAGYAGGIISAGVDGYKIVDLAFTTEK